MWKRKRIWFVFAASVGLLITSYFEPTDRVRAFVWGEAFFNGWPTSHWRGVVFRDLHIILADGPGPTDWERFYNEWLGPGPRAMSPFHLVRSQEANAVLHQLAKDENANIAAFAQEVLDEHQRMGPIPDDDAHQLWIRLRIKHQGIHPLLRNIKQ